MHEGFPIKVFCARPCLRFQKGAHCTKALHSPMCARCSARRVSAPSIRLNRFFFWIKPKRGQRYDSFWRKVAPDDPFFTPNAFGSGVEVGKGGGVFGVFSKVCCSEVFNFFFIGEDVEQFKNLEEFRFRNLGVGCLLLIGIYFEVGTC